jgi:DNA-binding beta-propeller fold protein YncE
LKKQVAIILFCFSTVLSGQGTRPLSVDSDTDDPFIKYVSSLPSGDAHRNIGFFERVFNLIVGYEPVVINNPVVVSAIGINNFWIVNQGDGTILHFLDGKTLKQQAFKKNYNSFPSLVGICSFMSEGILFTDSRLNKIFSLSEDGKQIKMLNDTINFSRPTGIACSDVTGEIWVAETGLHRISVLNKNGERKKTIGQRGSGNLEFNFPTYIWIDKAGRIYIVDSMNFRIQVLSPEGDFITAFGKQGDATGYFARPRGIATDSQDNIYVVDALFNVVQIFDISGKLLYYFGSQGNGKYQFWMPSGIFIDKNDFIYVSDSYNGRVQIFQLLKNNKK